MDRVDAIEPRQVFPPNQGLQFLVEIVPDAETRVTLNVTVDAKAQSAVAVCSSPPAADLVNYLNAVVLPASE